MTLIAASIAVYEPEELERDLARASDAVQSGSQMIEWRIDGLGERDDAAKLVSQLVQLSPAPSIVTCRAAWEGGDYRGDEHTRATLVESLLQADFKPRYIDVEHAAFRRDPQSWQSVRSALERAQRASDLNTSLVLSFHDFDGRPADLLQRIEAMAGDPLCAIVKVAWFARSLRDNLEAFDLLRDRHKPTIALCMGPFGLMSRVLAPKFGGFLTFATDRESEITGPGQPTIDDLLKRYRFDSMTPNTRVYGVIGWPVSHSLSPVIHNAGFAAIGFDGVYLPLPIPPEYEHFKATVGAFIDHRGLDFRGASVTIPHKENLLRFVLERGGRCDALTQRIGAANTLAVGSAGGLECFNTDCPAAVEALSMGIGIDQKELATRRIAVIGAGGVARAVVAGLTAIGATVNVFNRNLERAESLAQEFNQRESASGKVVAGAIDKLEDEHFDVFINCTPIGMEGGPAPHEMPLPPQLRLDESTTVFDTVYAPLRTPLIQEAETRGARTIHGMDMFIRQAAMQFERWTGVPGPVATFRAAITHTGRRP